MRAKVGLLLGLGALAVALGLRCAPPLAPAAGQTPAQPSPAAPAASTRNARVSFLQGQLLARGTTQQAYSYVQVNTVLQELDSIWTDPGSLAEIELEGDTFLRLGEDTKVELRRLPPDSDLRLWHGSMYADVSARQPQGLLIKTPAGDVDFDPDSLARLDVDKAGVATVSVFRGRVTVFPDKGDRVRVTEGRRVVLTPGAECGFPKAIGRDEPRDALDTFQLERTGYYAERPLPTQLKEPIVGARELAQYGKWVKVDDVDYWQPEVEPDWRPYRNGSWDVLNGGLSFAAVEPWGYAPTHYGRWWDAPDYGLLWGPTYDWGPNWCSWGNWGDNIAWAPLDPWDRPCYGSGGPSFWAGGFGIDPGYWSCAPGGFWGVGFWGGGFWGGGPWHGGSWHGGPWHDGHGHGPGDRWGPGYQIAPLAGTGANRDNFRIASQTDPARGLTRGVAGQLDPAAGRARIAAGAPVDGALGLGRNHGMVRGLARTSANGVSAAARGRQLDGALGAGRFREGSLAERVRAGRTGGLAGGTTGTARAGAARPDPFGREDRQARAARATTGSLGSGERSATSRSRGVVGGLGSLTPSGRNGRGGGTRGDLLGSGTRPRGNDRGGGDRLGGDRVASSRNTLTTPGGLGRNREGDRFGGSRTGERGGRGLGSGLGGSRSRAGSPSNGLAGRRAGTGSLGNVPGGSRSRSGGLGSSGGGSRHRGPSSFAGGRGGRPGGLGGSLGSSLVRSAGRSSGGVGRAARSFGGGGPSFGGGRSSGGGGRVARSFGGGGRSFGGGGRGFGGRGFGGGGGGRGGGGRR
jgi:hypothetical protein